MSQKSFDISMQILLQKVSCPGVWMCHSGPVALTIATMGTKFYTKKMTPKFPLVFLKKFTFRKKFQNVNEFGNELIYCELIQWIENDVRVLASYVGVLEDLICVSMMDDSQRNKVRLLTKAVNSFPGIISPIIEMYINTKLNKKNKIKELSHSEDVVISPFPDRKLPIYGQPVCHTKVSRIPAAIHEISTYNLCSFHTTTNCDICTNYEKVFQLVS